MFGRPVAGGGRPRDVPRRQRLLAARRRHRHATAQDQHRVEHRLSRFRRPAGHDRHRAGHGRHRARARHRSARRAQGEPAPRRLRPHTLWTSGRGLRDAIGDDRGARAVERLSRAARPHRGLQRDEPLPQARHRADARHVRHLVHADPAEPGWGAGARLFRRLDPSQSRRHRDGAGALHQGRPDRRGRVRRAAAFRSHHRDQHRQGSQRLADRGLLRHGPQRHGGADRRGRDQGPHGRLRRGTLGRAGGDGRVPRRPCRLRQPQDGIRRARQGLPNGAGAALPRRALQDAGDPLGPGDGDGPAVLLLRLWRGLRGGGDRHADGRDAGPARRPAARRRPFDQSGARHRAGRGRLHPGHGLADDGRAHLRRQGAAHHPRAGDLQDPRRLGRAAGLQHDAPHPAECDAERLSLEGGRRAAADACDLRLFGGRSTRSTRRTRSGSRGSRRPARPNRSSTPFARWAGGPEAGRCWPSAAFSKRSRPKARRRW